MIELRPHELLFLDSSESSDLDLVTAYAFRSDEASNAVRLHNNKNVFSRIE